MHYIQYSKSEQIFPSKLVPVGSVNAAARGMADLTTGLNDLRRVNDSKKDVLFGMSNLLSFLSELYLLHAARELPESHIRPK
jgi:hypothetical protein